MSIPKPVGPYVFDPIYSGPGLLSPARVLTPDQLKRFDLLGNSLVDRVNGSTFQFPVTSCVRDICDFTNYKKAQVSANFASFNALCQKVPTFLGSLNVTAPQDASSAEIEAFVDTLITNLANKLASRSCAANATP